MQKPEPLSNEEIIARLDVVLRKLQELRLEVQSIQSEVKG